MILFVFVKAKCLLAFRLVVYRRPTSATDTHRHRGGMSRIPPTELLNPGTETTLVNVLTLCADWLIYITNNLHVTVTDPMNSFYQK